MKILKGKQLLGVGRCLKAVRNEAGLTCRMMALKLGVHIKSYYKHERGVSLPCVETLGRLQTEFDISMDWLLFNNGTKHTKDKQVIVVEEKKNTDLENKFPEVVQLLDAMVQDHVLLHEVMLYFYKYRQNRQTETQAGLNHSKF